MNDVLHLWEWLYGHARDTEGEQALARAEVAFALVSACPDCWREPLSIRLLMIARFGPQNGHPLLDAHIWTADALKLIPWTPDEYRSVVENSEHQDDTQLDAMVHVTTLLSFSLNWPSSCLTLFIRTCRAGWKCVLPSG